MSPKIIGKIIPPLQSSLAPSACKTFEDMKETVIPALILLGPSLHYDPILMYKVSNKRKNIVLYLKCSFSRLIGRDIMTYVIVALLSNISFIFIFYQECGHCSF